MKKYEIHIHYNNTISNATKASPTEVIKLTIHIKTNVDKLNINILFHLS